MLYNIVLVSAIYQYESAIGIHMSSPSWPSFPSPTTSHTSGLSQSIWFEFPVSYSNFSVAIYFTYGNVYVSILLCQFVPFWLVWGETPIVILICISLIMRDGEGTGTPLQYSCLENPMDGAWKAAVHGVAEGWTWLNDFTFTFHFHALEKEMATHSSVLAWRIPGMGKPGRLPSMGSHRVGHNWSDLAIAIAIAIMRDVEHFFMCLSAICMSSLENVCLGLLLYLDWAIYFPDVELYELLMYSGD